MLREWAAFSRCIHIAFLSKKKKLGALQKSKIIIAGQNCVEDSSRNCKRELCFLGVSACFLGNFLLRPRGRRRRHFGNFRINEWSVWGSATFPAGMMSALFFARQTLARSSLFRTQRFMSQPQRVCYLPVYRHRMNPEKHIWRAYATSKVPCTHGTKKMVRQPLNPRGWYERKTFVSMPNVTQMTYRHLVTKSS